ncbi:PSP1 C-terminal conserved region family protein [Leishmania donovani]|nr:PSP1 C-terminal conserved region family protein [Leishmania donovani]
MASAAAGTSADTQGIFCTPIGRPHRATDTAPLAPVDELPVKRGCMGPLEVLSEVRAVNGYLQLLAEQLHGWAETGPSAVTCTSRSPTVTSAGGSGAHGYPAKPGATQAALSWRRASERDALYLLQTVMENTRRLVIQSQNVVCTLLSRDTVTSGATSDQASCGISYSESPFDVAKRSVDACAYPLDTEEPRVSLMRVMQGSPLRVALTPSLARSDVRDTSRTPASASATQPRLSDDVAAQPRRRRWPVSQFCYMTHVEFKRGRLRRFLSPVTVKAGAYVIVPGDRGYDCGLVVQCALWNPHKQAYDVDTIQSLDPGVLPPGNAGSIMEVIRVATDEEVHRLHREHVSMERLALTTCRDIADRLHLSMEVLDCEYQYDGTKISFFFDSAEVIDFRELNKELFRVFNARIWMQNTNTAVRNEAPRNVVPSRRAHRLRFGFQGTSSAH